MTNPPSSGVTMEARSQPGFRTTLTHDPSGAVLHTEAPRDNGGTGSSFSPTDLVAAALASCALTTMQLISQREGLGFNGARALVEKRMTPPPRRIGELILVIDMPVGLTSAQRTRLEEIARTCPVAGSLHPDVKAPIEFRYSDAPAP